MLLAAAPTAPVLSAWLAYDKVHTAVTDKLNAQMQSQAVEIVRLTAECASLNATITGLRTDIATLQEGKATAESRIAELEKQIVNIRDGYRHQIYEMRERMRGVLQGQLTRWLQTALDASRANPPKAAVIEERVEDALKLIEKEIQWLQPSA